VRHDSPVRLHVTRPNTPAVETSTPRQRRRARCASSVLLDQIAHAEIEKVIGST